MQLVTDLVNALSQVTFVCFISRVNSAVHNETCIIYISFATNATFKLFLSGFCTKYYGRRRSGATVGGYRLLCQSRHRAHVWALWASFPWRPGVVRLVGPPGRPHYSCLPPSAGDVNRLEPPSVTSWQLTFAAEAAVAARHHCELVHGRCLWRTVFSLEQLHWLLLFFWRGRHLLSGRGMMLDSYS